MINEMENIPLKNASDGTGFPSFRMEHPRGYSCKWSCVETRILNEALCDNCSDEIGTVETWNGKRLDPIPGFSVGLIGTDLFD